MTYNDIIQKAGKRIKKHVYYIENNTTTNVSDDNVERVTEAAKGVASSSELVASAASSVSEAVDTINGNLERFTIQ